MKVLFKTERTAAVSTTPEGSRHAGVAWFELVLHDGPPDDTTWEGCGHTVTYWREQFARRRDRAWRIPARGIEGVEAAIIPDEVVRGLPEDARISFHWTFVPPDVPSTT